MIALTDFKPIDLSALKPQGEVLDYFAWVIAAFQCREGRVLDAAEAEAIFARAKARVWEFGVSPEYISARQLNALPAPFRGPDGSPKLPDLLSFAGGARGSDLGARMRRFKEISRQVFERAYETESARPSSLVHVSCVGYISPSAAQEFVVDRGWADTGVTHSYHMGCYGAFPAVKMARGFLSDRHQSHVDLVHTEFLSLHADYSTLDPGTIVNMTLFGDGFVKYSAVRSADLAGRPGFEILAQYETIIPNTQEEMTWVPSGNIFEMYLSKNVPLRIKENVRAFVTELCRRADLNFEREGHTLNFAIHPGGPKILDHIEEELGIDAETMRWSRAVLAERGNMSSATIPHIWARMLNDVPSGSLVVSMAFGPGLTAIGAVLRRI